jgi:hypothetical protein
MKVALAALLGIWAPLAAFAQYSEGWKPGQPVSRAVPTASTGFDPKNPQYTAQQPVGGAPVAESQPTGGFVERGIEKMITSGPVKALFDKAGVNVTEKLEAAKKAQAEMWHADIPLIDDDNYDLFVTNETFANEAEESKRVWFFIMWDFPFSCPYKMLTRPQHRTKHGRPDVQVRRQAFRRRV